MPKYATCRRKQSFGQSLIAKPNKICCIFKDNYLYLKMLSITLKRNSFAFSKKKKKHWNRKKPYL